MNNPKEAASEAKIIKQKQKRIQTPKNQLEIAEKTKYIPMSQSPSLFHSKSSKNNSLSSIFTFSKAKTIFFRKRSLWNDTLHAREANGRRMEMERGDVGAATMLLSPAVGGGGGEGVKLGVMGMKNLNKEVTREMQDEFQNEKGKVEDEEAKITFYSLKSDDQRE
ncbi:uncharacterized protein MONOS_1520 [Monocercomonoides exilis]|uniref:uncharacterized protein n=1 Tax=Monocercomonoides exilis TaxID=2049356 RepID=UPI003559B410|nr:hypothetical protein MONOS_1520 [Monocercomonoides exilis]|eukprot:MONOS_1520.1-p1 / transcript=MONOS_1520.1 / gene=MONOS_1520 / organism=Monocercomonoides_exilis_PA203 / gene_product=unspecified product / transcript_product=unspecified product / location=Mono_scaffold00027:45738-46232(+) / protein_length=165 / sequence_SO=supercontig / SO=protein_coding / is_pseudo=false